MHVTVDRLQSSTTSSEYSILRRSPPPPPPTSTHRLIHLYGNDIELSSCLAHGQLFPLSNTITCDVTNEKTSKH